MPDYWHPQLEIQSDFLSGGIGRYPLSMRAKAEYPGELSEERVPVVFVDQNPCVLPVTVVLFGLGSHDAFFATMDQRYYRQMMAALHWLEEHSTPLGAGVGWPNNIDLPVYKVKAPWFSGLVQGLVLSLLVRAHRVEPGSRWTGLIDAAWKGFHVPVECGGFARNFSDGVIYEEYPGPELDCVFNGMCHSLIGLWEAWKSNLVNDAKQDFDKGIRALSLLLPRFSRRNWSLYSLSPCLGKPLLASPYYQRANGLLAQIIGLMADHSELYFCGQRWAKASHSLPRRLSMSLRIGMDRFLAAPSLLHSDKAKKAS